MGKRGASAKTRLLRRLWRRSCRDGVALRDCPQAARDFPTPAARASACDERVHPAAAVLHGAALPLYDLTRRRREDAVQFVLVCRQRGALATLGFVDDRCFVMSA